MEKALLYSVVLIFLVWPSSSALDSFVVPNFDANETFTWTNNASIADTIDYEDGSFARLILKTVGNDSIQLPPFGCGFIRPAKSTSYFLGVLLLGGRNTRVADQQVWLANRDKPIKENGKLEFTSARGLELFDSNNTQVWYSEVASDEGIEGIELVDNGKLQLYKGEQSYWHSFNYLTESMDTFLPGQKLYKGDMLRASASAADWSSTGKYYFKMEPDHCNAFALQAHKEMTYFQLGPEEANNTGLHRRRDAEDEALGKEITVEKATITYDPLRCDCRKEPKTRPSTYAALDGENLVLTIGTNNHSFRVSPDSAAGSYRYLRLGSDGHLTTYQWQKDGVPKPVYDLVAVQVDACQLPQACGDYGVCGREGVNCSCPKARNGSTYLEPINKRDPAQGCSSMTPYSCEAQSYMLDFGNLSHFSFIDNHSAEGNPGDLQGCKEKCRRDCECRAAFFKFSGSTSHGECYMVLSGMLSTRADPIPGLGPYNSSAFIKVQLSSQSPVPPPPETPSQDTSSTTNLVPILLGSLAAVLSLFVSALCIVISRKKNNNKKKEKEERESEGEDNFNPNLRMPRRFSYEELRIATDDFKDRLGGGGFGTVFRGELEDSTRIAVKRLDSRAQGMKEFLAEVETIGNIHHVNLVRLIGFCTERSYKLLVYEYVSNGSLDAWIFNSQRNQDIDWQTRKKIILGIAKGLAYLHDECFQRIVHLDIKPQNILLDDDFNAKISDFGLSKQMDRDQSQVQTTIRGTPGYLAPEWRQLRITLKVDIYSFGIVVLEIICGRRNLDSSRSESSKHLLRLLQEKAEAGRLMDIAEGARTDMQLHGDEVLRMIMLAVWCLQDDHARRPQMSVVVKVLEGVTEVDPNISYRFSNAMMAQAPAIPSHSDPQPASTLSAPR